MKPAVGGNVAHRFLWPARWGFYLPAPRNERPGLHTWSRPPQVATHVCEPAVFCTGVAGVRVCARERASVCACVSACGNSITPAPGADPLCKHSHQREDKKLVKMIHGQRRGPCVGREDVVGQVRMKIFHAWSEALLGTNQNPLLQTSCEGRISHKYLVLLKASIC